jgi:tetratricopeptide (TPR) repeat protein
MKTPRPDIDPQHVTAHNNATAAYDAGDLKKALRLALQLLQTADVPTQVQVNAAAIVIDCSSVAESVEPVEQAIAVLTEHLDSAGGKRDLVAYNLANGHIGALDVESRLGGQHGYVFRSPHVDESKNLLRSVIDSDSANVQLRSMAYVNYASTFSKVGRSLEVLAIDKDALAANPDNAVAEGGIGITLSRLASTLGEHRLKLLEEARLHLARALEDEPHLIQYGGSLTADRLRKTLEKVEHELAAKGGGAVAECGPDAPQSDLEAAYRRFCLRHDLMLNYCSICTQCPGEMRDTIFFRSLRLPVDDDSKFRRLATFFNQIKEDYAAARYLTFSAERQSSDLDDISVMTRYANTLDYAAFDLYGGLLKSAFRGAADTLDKVAGFMAVYLDVPKPSWRKVNFANLWWADRAGPLRPPFDALLPKNAGIAALADLARDWRERTRPEWRLYELRNSLVHRFVALHSEMVPDGDSDPGPHLSLRAFRDQTIEMLQLVRAAIVYMTIAVVACEREKRSASDGLVLPMYFDFSQEPDYRVMLRAEDAGSDDQ